MSSEKVAPLNPDESSIFRPLTKYGILIHNENVYYAERRHWVAMVQPAYETFVFSLIIVYAATPWHERWALIASFVAIAPAAVLIAVGGQLRHRFAADPFANPIRPATRTRLIIGLVAANALLVFMGFTWLYYVSIVAVMGRLIMILARWSYYERRYITDRRVIEAGGLLGSRISSIPLSRATDISYTRTIFGEILGYSSMRVETAGQEQALGIVPFIANPRLFYEVLIQFSAPAGDQ